MSISCVKGRGGVRSGELPHGINVALQREYGVVLEEGCHGHHTATAAGAVAADAVDDAADADEDV